MIQVTVVVKFTDMTQNLTLYLGMADLGLVPRLDANLGTRPYMFGWTRECRLLTPCLSLSLDLRDRSLVWRGKKRAVRRKW